MVASVRRAAKRDTNHATIETIFRSLLGVGVTDSSGWGSGAGDLFVSVGTVYRFIEIKRDAKAKLTPAQVAFRTRHPGATIRCETPDQAIEICHKLRKLAHT
jgi:hypothetical protein